MKEIHSQQYAKLADLKTSIPVPHPDAAYKDQGDIDFSKHKKKRRRVRRGDTKKLYQVNRTVRDISINDLR